MKYAISILALTALLFTAAGASSAGRDATTAETASVAEALREDGCVLSTEVKVRDNVVFEAGGVACENGNYDVELDADFNVLSKTKVRPAVVPD
ncbi:MAG: hypothetical protein KJ002_07975 [Candidatus Dadabacteria bacterium]|nr:hypothetical protein [Candidatus Dadabacteria bacterium]